VLQRPKTENLRIGQRHLFFIIVHVGSQDNPKILAHMAHQNSGVPCDWAFPVVQQGNVSGVHDQPMDTALPIPP